jgi:hypothetical protein
MKYSTFERLVLVLGGASVLATLALASRAPLLTQEVVAQLLVFGVLFGAVHWGRRGGFAAAVIASVTYVVIWIPLLEPGDLTPQIMVLMALRVLAYGLIGIIGGALCSKMKYVLASLEQSSGVDEVTGVFSEMMLARLLDGATGRFERYQEPFCLIVLEPTQTALRAPTTNRERATVRHVAAHVQSDIRMVDEAARTLDGRLMVLLPHTPKDGGSIVTERLTKGVARTVGNGDQGDAFMLRCLGAAEDSEAIAKLRSALHVPIEDQALSPA